MDDDLDYAAGLLFFTIAAIYLRYDKGANRPVRRWWVHPINQVREHEGAWSLLMGHFQHEFPDKHYGCMRVSKDSSMLFCPSSSQRFKSRILSCENVYLLTNDCVTLVYLATGDSFQTLALLFRIGESTARAIVYETCQALWKTMSGTFLKTPTTPEEWQAIAAEFHRQWNFPHCLGSIDGKHCAMQAPANTGSHFYNYKKHFSMVLMAVSDASYKFTYVDVGTPGRWSDGGTFDYCSLNACMEAGNLNVPAASPLPG